VEVSDSDASDDHAVSALLCLVVIAFSVPGAVVLVLFVINWLSDLNRLKGTSVGYRLAAAFLIGGVLSIPATPLAAIFAFVGRHRLKTRLGTVAKFLAATAAIGWIAFALRYANPFFRG
jgi:hypothetical protein